MQRIEEVSELRSQTVLSSALRIAESKISGPPSLAACHFTLSYSFTLRNQGPDTPPQPSLPDIVATEASIESSIDMLRIKRGKTS